MGECSIGTVLPYFTNGHTSLPPTLIFQRVKAELLQLRFLCPAPLFCARFFEADILRLSDDISTLLPTFYGIPLA